MKTLQNNAAKLLLKRRFIGYLKCPGNSVSRIDKAKTQLLNFLLILVQYEAVRLDNGSFNLYLGEKKVVFRLDFQTGYKGTYSLCL